MEKLVKISMHISKILRHDTEGLFMTKDGYVQVNELIDHIGISKSMLDEIVKTNDKKRFAYSDDGMMIRASQGHSIGVNLGLKPTRPPMILWHGTSLKSLEAIKKMGVISKMQRDYLHLSIDMETATSVGMRHAKDRKELALLSVDSGAMYADGYKFYISDNGVWLTDEVPMKYVKLIP